MGTISTAFDEAFRNFVTENVPLSGINEPQKSEIRAIGPVIESAISTIGAANLADYQHETKVEADTAASGYMDGEYVLVWGDSDDANNDLWLVDTGDLILTGTNGIFHDTISSLAGSYTRRSLNSVPFDGLAAGTRQLSQATDMQVGDQATIEGAASGATVTDPVTAATVIENGKWQYVDTPSTGWTRVDDLDSQQAEGFKDQAQTASQKSALEVDNLRVKSGDPQTRDIELIGGNSLYLGGMLDAGVAVAWRDSTAAGNMGLAVTSDGAAFAPEMRSPKFTGADFNLSSARFTNYDFAIQDGQGNVVFGLIGSKMYGPDGLVGSGGTATTSLAAKDARNELFSAEIMSQRVTNVQWPVVGYNLHCGYGQSLQAGNETWPALSQTQLFGNVSLGQLVIPQANTSAQSFTPIGGTSWQPLIAATYTPDGNFLTQAEEDLLVNGDQTTGEIQIIGGVNFAKFLLNQRSLLENDTDRIFAAFTPANGGNTIEQLSKVNTQDSTNRWGRLTDGLSKSITASGATPIASLVFDYRGNEYNCEDRGGSWDYDSFYTLLDTLLDDYDDEVAARGFVNTAPTAKFIYQTSAQWGDDVDSFGNPDLHVQRAQIDLMLARDDLWCHGPVYPYPDKGGHLGPNGSRWQAGKAGQVWHRVTVERLNFQPLRVIEVEQESTTSILIHMHVPHAPVVFEAPFQYAGHNRPFPDDKGFRVTDQGGDIAAVASIVGRTIIRLTLARAVDPGSCKVWFADNTVHLGNGCVRDSDPTLSIDVYEYLPDRGMTAGMDEPDFNDKPYPLWNWLCAGVWSLGYSEF
ncbi:hypothetical protein [Novosphingobium sp. MBES04]|uniref:hypothetical protein n=1 Tax=Novosphingobium sp. MBES04 TaxID=1206458 RepID=UPI00057C3668|nr:hypothetical protein [Novosphingobium sp. MBES04]GAM06318.1 hypothetical protein MBENS4_3315 [Novosphingobium sp. MBES04]